MAPRGLRRALKVAGFMADRMQAWKSHAWSNLPHRALGSSALDLRNQGFPEHGCINMRPYRVNKKLEE